MNGTKSTTNRNELSLSSLVRGITRTRITTPTTTTGNSNGIQQQQQQHVETVLPFDFRKTNSNRNTIRISEQQQKQQQQRNDDTSNTDEINYSLENDDEEEIVFVYSNDNSSSSNDSDNDDNDNDNDNDDSTVTTPTYYDPPIIGMLPVSPTTTVTTGTTTVHSSTQRQKQQQHSSIQILDTAVYNTGGNRQQQQQHHHRIRNIDTSMSVQSVTSITTSVSDPIAYSNNSTMRKTQLQVPSQPHQQQQQLVATTTNIHEMETPIAANVTTTTTRGSGIEEQVSSNNNINTTTSEFATTTKQQQIIRTRQRRNRHICCTCVVMWIIIITSLVLGIVFSRKYSMSDRFSTSPSSNNSSSDKNNSTNIVVPFFPTPTTTISTIVSSSLSPSSSNNNNNNNNPTSVIENIVAPSIPNYVPATPLQRPIQQQMTMPPKLRPVIIVQPQTTTTTTSPIDVINPRRRPTSVPMSQPVVPRPVLNIVPVQQQQPAVEQSPSSSEVIWTIRPTVQITGTQSRSQLGTKFTMNTDGTIIVVSENEDSLETTSITVYYAKSFVSNTTVPTTTTMTGWEKIGQNSLRYVQDSIVSISINDNGTILVISLVNDVIVYQYNTIGNDWEMIRRGIERIRIPTTQRQQKRRMRTLQNNSINSTSQYYKRETIQQYQEQDARQIQSQQQQEEEDDIQLSSVTVFGSGVSNDGNSVIFGQVSSLNVNVTDTNRRMTVYSTIYSPITSTWSNNTIILSKQGTTTINYDPINIVLSSNGQLVAVSYRKSTSLSTTTAVDVFEYKQITTNPSSSLSLFRWVLLGTIPSFDNIASIKCALYYSAISGQHRIGIGGIQRLDSNRDVTTSSSSITSIPIQVLQYNPITDVWVLVGDTAGANPSLGYGTDVSFNNNGNRIAIKQLQSTATVVQVDELIVVYDYNPNTLDWIRIGEINKTTAAIVSQQQEKLFSNDNNWDMYYSSVGNRMFLAIPQYSSSSSVLLNDTTTNNVGTILVFE